MIRINNLAKKFGHDNLFENVNLVIHKGDKIALLGQNGTGKSTFVKCILGEEKYDVGLIEVDDKLNISVMVQEKEFEDSESNFLDYLNERNMHVKNKIIELEKRFEEPDIYSDEKEFQKIMYEHEILVRQSSQVFEDIKFKEILKRLNFEEDKFNTPLYKLSGGQKMKLRIAECLSKDADIYFLDEPTNHLDFDTMNQLDTELSNKETVFIISHDRYLLNKFAKKIIEIENKSFQIYGSGYEKYMDEKEHRHQLIKKFHNENVKRREELTALIRQLRVWASIAGNQTKRIQADRFEAELKKLPQTMDPEKFTKEFRISFDNERRAGSMAFQISDVSKKYHNQELFSNVNFEIERGEKVGIVGSNGSGKSTFLKIIAGIIEGDSGKVKIGPNTTSGYFDQELQDFDQDQTVMDFFKTNFGHLKEERLMALIAGAGMSPHTFKQSIKSLSGGEKARLNIIRLMVENHNVLLLDEPTNNLDIKLIETLENALGKFKGTMLFISHDRYFIDKVANRLFVLKDGKITSKKGNYSDNFSN
ncbi:ABC-F family ATP-binding cassette domain-containing protein [Candidatus Pacearchaeota archaeon]|nr:ABC-F family ATP-binding cassette domain-containing protein [Candidatus Pacearchaeota archaeon]